MQKKISEPVIQKKQTRIISMHTNYQINTNIQMAKKDNPVEFFKKFSKFLNKQDIIGAEKCLANFKPEIDQSYLLYYFRGCIYKLMNQSNIALEFFEKSITANPNFWPGAIQCGFIHTETDTTRAYKSYLVAANLLEIYEKNNLKTYDYLFEGFTVKYLYNICTSYIKKELSQC